ncbi:MAG: hypothetical protein KU37_07380 [Sulfuricurvum sp. PC08-66]|nr:MAG: hypothetical protein KU37_07380 [Sulfuricurvum sp. PC08-66]
MATQTLKTQPTDADVFGFLETIADERKRNDCYTVLEMMEQITGEEAQMWGENIVGFGRIGYRYASGRVGEWMKIGFAPRKNDLTLYLMGGLASHEVLLSKLGKHKEGKSCLYVRTLENIDTEVLRKLLRKSVEALKSHPMVTYFSNPL